MKYGVTLSQLRYHQPYSRAKRWGLEFDTICGPILGVAVRSLGARDWDGSAYTSQVAYFRLTPSGWEYEGTAYPSLLRAVRVYYTTDRRATRLRHLARMIA